MAPFLWMDLGVEVEQPLQEAVIGFSTTEAQPVGLGVPSVRVFTFAHIGTR